jgi:hypothetical protein
LSVSVAAAPARPTVGSIVKVEVTVRDQHAAGTLGYLLRYGDGTTAGSAPVSQVCVAGVTRAATQSSSTSHRYRSKGTYVVLVQAYVNCETDHATAATRIVVH